MADEVINIVFKVADKSLTKAEGKVKSLNDEVAKSGKKGAVSMKGLGGAFGAVAVGAGAAAAAVLAFGKSTLDAAREIDNLSNIAGLSAEKFQRQAHAARSVGIEQDKYADIIKDVNDKVGDFLVTGAGPMADFFDSIGKKVGVTAEDFKGLSGDQALGLYVDTLQKAGANQQEVAFHMEALASDATALVPLLANNAKGMRELGEAAGYVLSDEQIANAEALNQAMDNMGSQVLNRLKGAFIDVATEAANFFNLLGTEAEKEARRNMEALDDQVADLQASLKDLADNEVSGVAKSFAEINDIEFRNLAGFDDIDDEGAERLRGILERQLELKKQQFHAASDTLGAARQQATVEREIADAIADQGFSADGSGSGTSVEDEVKLEEIKVNVKKRGLDLCKKQETCAEKIARQAQEQKDALVAQRVEWGLLTDFASVHLQDLRDLQEALANGTITAEEYGKAILNIAKGEDGEENPWAGLTDELTSLETQMKQMKTDAIMGIADGFAEMAASGKGSFKEMAASMLKDIAKLIIKTLILRAIMSFINPAAAAPVAANANGGIIGPGEVSMVGERGPELIQPASAMRVIPNHALGGGTGGGVSVGSINVTVQERKDETSEEQAARIGRQIKEEMRTLVVQELGNQSRKGNMLNPAPITAFRS